MNYSIIQKSQIEGALRIDAEYYQPEYLEITRVLKSIPNETLEQASRSLVSFGAYALTSFIEWQESGVPLITAENIKDGFIDYDGVRYIGEKVDEILKKSRVREGQVLLAMSGSVGNAAVADHIPTKLNSNQDIVKITPREGLSPYLLAAFLNSRFGKMQVLRLPVGSIQQHIFLWQMQTMLIPLVDEKNSKVVEELYKSGLKELEKTKSLYSQAENSLLEELGLKGFESKNELWRVVNLSEVQSSKRIDAEYFQPKYNIIESKIKRYNHKLLTKCIENVLAKFDPTKQPDKPFKYIELSNINASIGTIDGFSDVLGKEAPNRAKRVLKNNDVIVSSVEGSLGKVALVDKEQKGFLASTGFFQFRSKEILSEVLLVLAKSIVFQRQLEKRCAGTILTAVPKESIKDILVPILPKPIQQKISELVKQSHDARKKAKELLEEAKRKVEEMIENNNK